MANLNQQYLNIQPRTTTLRPNTHLADALASALVDALPEEATREIRFEDDSGTFVAISREHVPFIAELLQEVVAYTVSTLIDAGSERDAVMENDTLHQALEQELNGWAVP